MTLFGDDSESDLKRAITLVEQIIGALGVDVERSRLPGAGNRYALRRGSASLLVSLAPQGPDDGEGYLRVAAKVVRLPKAPPAQTKLFKHLLTLNGSKLVNAAFGIIDDEIVVVSERGLRDLNASEVDAIVRTVGAIADRYDDELAREHGTTRSCDDPD